MSYKQRVVIVDFNHLGYKFAYGMGATTLYSTIPMQDGSVRRIATNIQNGAGKAIHRWTRGGVDIPVVAFDRPCRARKEWHGELYPVEGTEKASGYKSGRSSAPRDMLEAIEMTCTMLEESGVLCVYSGDGGGYEADDLIKAAVDKAKEEFPGMPIDIVTGDADMLPLVDEDVSVFIVSKKGTYSTDKSIEKNKYWQVTPENFGEYVSGLSAYKAYTKYGEVPYNTVLLIKMLRGDSSDNVPALASKSMTPRRVMDIINDMKETGFNLADTFRYGGDLELMTFVLLPYVIQDGELKDELLSWFSQELSKGEGLPTGKLFDDKHNVSQFFIDRFGDIASTSGTAAKDGYGGMIDMCHIRKNYSIMNLNSDLGGHRKPARIRRPSTFSEHKYAEVFSRLGIRINIA